MSSLLSEDFGDFAKLSASQHNIVITPEQLLLQDPENVRHYFLIRTMNRPRRLKILVESIIAEVKNFGINNVQIIILDSSSDHERKVNTSYLNGLSEEKISWAHEFISHNETSAGVKRLLSTTPTHQSDSVIPKEKSFGQASNYLSLLGLLHSFNDAKAGYEPIFHFFDDDVSIHNWRISKGSCGLNVVRPIPPEESFIQNTVNALQKAAIAYAMVGGVKDRYHAGYFHTIYELLNAHLLIVHTHLKDNPSSTNAQTQKSIHICTTLIHQLLEGRLPLFSEFCYSEHRREDNYYGCSAQQNPLGLSVTRGVLALMPYLLKEGNEDLIYKSSLEALGIKHSYHTGRLFNWFGEHEQPLTMPENLRSKLGVSEETLMSTSAHTEMFTSIAQELLSYINDSLPDKAKTQQLLRLATLLDEYLSAPRNEIATYAPTTTLPSNEAVHSWHTITSRFIPLPRA